GEAVSNGSTPSKMVATALRKSVSSTHPGAPTNSSRGPHGFTGAGTGDGAGAGAGMASCARAGAAATNAAAESTIPQPRTEDEFNRQSPLGECGASARDVI